MSDFTVSLTPAPAINVSVSGGVGPQGPTGPAGGVTSVNGATGALTLAAVGGSWSVAGTTITLTVTGGGSGASSWGDVTGKPFSTIGAGLAVDGSGVLSATGLTSVSWGDITGKPSTFSPSAHTHAASEVTGLGTLATQSGTFSGTSSGVNTGDQTISLTGDVTGSGTGSFAATLSASGVTAGTYTSVTVDAKGRVTAGSNPVATYTRQFAISGSTSYLGRAVSGSATTASVWTIKRTIFAADGSITSTATATNVRWVDYLTATYV